MDLAGKCHELMVKLAEDRFTLAVVGQFKRGKSSLMNATIGRDLLPTGNLPLTSAISRSVSLQGFGIDSVIEMVAGGILLWRLLVEQRGGSVERIERAERRASWITAISLFALAIYIVSDSALTLLTSTRPESS